jgi:hypothetical protein
MALHNTKFYWAFTVFYHAPIIAMEVPMYLQGWEEMVDASVTHLLRTRLSKNAKDVTLNPMPLSSLKDVQNVKKHIAMMCDRLSKGAKLSDGKTKLE